MTADCPPPFATVDDLTAWLGEGDLDAARAEAVIGAATVLVRSHVGAWQWPDGTPRQVPQAFTVVTTQVAARYWQNPTGARQETTGPFSVTYDGGGVELTDSEVRMLDQAAHGSSIASKGLWTLSTTRDELEVTDYRPVEGGGDPIPMFVEGAPWG